MKGRIGYFMFFETTRLSACTSSCEKETNGNVRVSVTVDTMKRYSASCGANGGLLFQDNAGKLQITVNMIKIANK